MSLYGKQLNSEAQHHRMVSTPIPRLVLGMAIPTVASQLITVIYNTADTYFVSQLDNNSASGAVGVVFALMSVIQAFGFGLGMGANSLISTTLGEKKDDLAARYGNSAFAAAIAFGFILMAGGLIFLEPLMRLFGATDTILPYACDYSIYILIGAPVMCSSFVLSNILRSEGEATLSMVGLCAGGIVNIVLDPLLIFGANMDISGAALATLISQCVSFLILLSFFLRKKSNIRLGISYVSRDAKIYLNIFKRGFPTICRQGMASVASALLNNSAGAVGGDAAIAAMTVANKVYMLVRNVVVGIGQGFQPVAGYNFGAGEKRRVKEAFWVTTALGSGVCIITAVFLFPFAEQAILLFRDDPEVVEIGRNALRFCCFVLPTMAYSTYVNQLYQCLGFSTTAALLASCRQGIFFIPAVLILPHIIGITGIEMAQPLADLLTALVSVYFHIKFFQRVLK
ncbi:MAG: MATE family efflux transporter [Clostridia bacterium]|nr:MATE family efflux transporter [Clostridia bacterium]